MLYCCGGPGAVQQDDTDAFSAMRWVADRNLDDPPAPAKAVVFTLTFIYKSGRRARIRSMQAFRLVACYDRGSGLEPGGR